MNTEDAIKFPKTYKQSRERFRQNLKDIQKKWPGAQLQNLVISATEDLSIDWISAGAADEENQCLVLTSGIHGVEGFVGSAMMDLFIQNYLGQLNPIKTGLLLVHALNPWGMEHRRRVNSNNVDLNRNFMSDPITFQEEFNPDYNKLNPFLNPREKIKNLLLEKAGFYFKLLEGIMKHGISGFRAAVLFGQQSHPGGLYFSGDSYQPETKLMMELFEMVFQEYQSVLHFDFHTGYGPRYQMSLVNSTEERRKANELEEKFQYPRVISADPDQFYAIKGDMIDWAYRFNQKTSPGVKYYGTAFEFGTYGDSLLAEITSLQTMIFENQRFKYGSQAIQAEQTIRNRFLELYFPNSWSWQKKALVDCRQAFEGILNFEGFITD